MVICRNSSGWYVPFMMVSLDEKIVFKWYVYYKSFEEIVMRRFIRNQILELLSTIWEGVKQAKALEPQAAESVLTDCYHAIQSVEHTLQDGLSQEAFSRYTDLLGLLKGHLEETNAGIAQGLSVADIAKKFKTGLKGLRKILLQEKEIKLEIVFFPYKASMWDALESIWFAARDDEDCDAYVVPIPYYDRLPNGEFGDMHYEGDLYPDYVPVLNWRSYDVENRRPDIVFIHNPYDNGNFVTSVHPDFYSKRLRECTDMLVYIPYFINESGKGKIPEHFCTTAGCVYAHKTIVQSEKVCETYIRVFQSAFRNHFGNPKEKFIPLGSPKIDKVINTKREDYKLPEKWRRLLAGKKAVLFNTSVGAMLQDSEKYLAKMLDVFNVYRKHREVVLWWRPHPLMESTLNSMRPALADTYRKMIADYKHDAYGIFDDTQDLNRAIAWNDAYYGDAGSSLLALWFATGKPLLVQDVSRLSDCSENITGDISKNAFYPVDAWKDFLETPEYPQINLQNLLEALAANKLPPLPFKVFSKTASTRYQMPEGGAGKAIYQYIKRQVVQE